jgi:hypothetical protein
LLKECALIEVGVVIAEEMFASPNQSTLVACVGHMALAAVRLPREQLPNAGRDSHFEYLRQFAGAAVEV